MASRTQTRLLLVALCATIAMAVPAAASGARGLRPDRTFGAGRGFATTAIAGTSSVAYGAIVTGGGQIAVAGQASPPSGNGQVVVARYTRSGRLDRGFASGGIFKSAFPTADAPFIATAIAVDRRKGKLVVAGGYAMGSMLVMRLTARGRLDPATSTPAGTLTVAVQSRLTQLLPSGVLDRRFAPGGVFGIARPRGVFINALAAPGSNRLVAAGSAGNSIYVARWLK